MGRKKKPDPTADTHGRVTVVNLKGPQVDRDWLDGIANKTMIPASRIVRAALKEWARKHGHPAPPWMEDKAK